MNPTLSAAVGGNNPPVVTLSRLKYLRQRKLLTIEELARRADVSENTITRLEHGHPAPRPGTIRNSPGAGCRARRAHGTEAATMTPVSLAVYALTDRRSGAVYIGAAQNVKRRWYFHRSELRNGRHPHQVALADGRKAGTLDSRSWSRSTLFPS